MQYKHTTSKKQPPFNSTHTYKLPAFNLPTVAVSICRCIDY